MNLKRTVAVSAVALVSMGGAGIAIAQTNSDDPIRPAVLEDTVSSSTTLAQSDSATGPDDTLVPAPDSDDFDDDDDDDDRYDDDSIDDESQESDISVHTSRR